MTLAEVKAERRTYLEREWMQEWVKALPAEEEQYIRKQPGIDEAEVQKRLVHWERRKIENRTRNL